MPDVSGWAPCIHEDGAREKLIDEGYFFVDDKGERLSIEGLIYEISMIGSYPAMGAEHGMHIVTGVDQWWGVWVEGEFRPPDDERPPLLLKPEMGIEERQRVTEEWRESPEVQAWLEKAADPKYVFKTFIQGDTLELALTETLKRWVARYEELYGRKYEF